MAMGVGIAVGTQIVNQLFLHSSSSTSSWSEAEKSKALSDLEPHVGKCQIYFDLTKECFKSPGGDCEQSIQALKECMEKQ